MLRSGSWTKSVWLSALALALVALGALPLEAGSKQEKVEKALEKAEDYLSRTKADWAKKQYRRAYKLSEGESVEAALGLARLEIRDENYDEAISYARRAVEKATEPQDQTAGHYLLGQAAFFRQIAVPENLKEAGEDLSNPVAETAFQKASKLGTPVQPAALVMLTELLTHQGRRAEARRVLDVLDNGEAAEDFAHRLQALRCELEMLQYEGKPAAEYEPPAWIPDAQVELFPPNSLPLGEGTVVLAFVVDEEGKPRCVRILRSFFGTPPSGLASFDEASFEPATVDGEPVPARSLHIMRVESSLSFSTY